MICATLIRSRLNSGFVLLMVLGVWPLSLQAKRSYSPNCSECHSSQRDGFVVLNSGDVYEYAGREYPFLTATAGESVLIDLEVVDGHDRYAFAIHQETANGVNDPEHELRILGDSAWEDRGDYWTTPNSSNDTVWQFVLSVPSDTIPDVYWIDVTLAGENGGRWSQSERVALEVRPGNPGIQLIASGADWQFYYAADPPPVNWNQWDASDLRWETGPSPLGYGESGLASVLPSGDEFDSTPVTAFFRHEFSLSDVRALVNVQAQVLYDDGIRIFLNGNEVGRYLLDSDADAFTLANETKSGSAETAWDGFDLPIDHFRDGLNLIAIEVHQASLTSSDLALDFQLFAEIQPLLIVTPSEIRTIKPMGWSCVLEESVNLIDWVRSSHEQRIQNSMVIWPIGSQTPSNRFYRLLLQ